MTGSYSGGIRPFYGVIIRDKLKSKSTSAEVLRAYKTVGEDLLKEGAGEIDAQDLRAALQELDRHIGQHGGHKT